MAYVGGLRRRLIKESIYQEINDALDDLGWFDDDRQHLPLTFRTDPVPDDEAISPNLAAITDLDEIEEDDELGTQLALHRWTMYVDIFAENDAVALHFIGDVRDILGGRIHDVDRTDPSVVVRDYTQATPVDLFRVQIENIMTDRGTVYDRQFQAHWLTCRFEVVDYYGNETY